MSIWISVLLAFLPKLLEWILSLVRDNKQVSERQQAKLNHVLYYCHELNRQAPAVGLRMGGVKPAVEGVESGEIEPVSDADERIFVGGMLDSWIQKFILDHLKTNGKELGLKIAKTVLLPWLKEQAAKTSNKVDDYAVKQLERMLNDPELIAIMEGVG